MNKSEQDITRLDWEPQNFIVLQGIKVLIARFYTVYSAVLDCKAGLNIVVLLLCCCKFCEHQTCVTARANLIIFQLSHQIPTAPTQNVHSNEYHSKGRGDQSPHLHLSLSPRKKTKKTALLSMKYSTGCLIGILKIGNGSL